MKTYTPFEFLCIDIANQGYDDKKLFEERIQWVKENFNRLLFLETGKKERPLYVKAVTALYRACRGEAIGHMVGLDATCSGMSIMSVVTKCYKGCLATNLIDPDVRNDAYTMVTDEAGNMLDGDLIVTRGDAKDATMTTLYGSQAKPREIFGTDTEELDAFYAGLVAVAPRAVELLGDLRMAWQPFALEHRWVCPDNFNVRIKVMQKVEGERVEVDELDGASFTYEYYVNEGTKSDLKLVANVTHSLDAYLLRSMERRCNYNPDDVRLSYNLLMDEQVERHMGYRIEQDLTEASNIAQQLIAVWGGCEMPEARLFTHLSRADAQFMSDKHIQQMLDLATQLLEREPFEIVTVHDEFKCHANNCNWMRLTYVQIMADLARARVLEDIYEQITGLTPTYEGQMDGDELAALIMGSNYALS
ncbi:RNA polymerase [Pseudomonas phage phCDa]|uniref:DNA-directed RNA polymerase n=1 Tax=Pseudomonas phage phCDa TaxID=2268587 RepID=A0A2Z5HA56_9CAUD|nr:RNA polymerase [Pseudomonas phage phCDa]AXC36498.1 DNA-directed RNA polymerase [Pseudomonas phage phCDa]